MPSAPCATNEHHAQRGDTGELWLGVASPTGARPSFYTRGSHPLVVGSAPQPCGPQAARRGQWHGRSCRAKQTWGNPPSAEGATPVDGESMAYGRQGVRGARGLTPVCGLSDATRPWGYRISVQALKSVRIFIACQFVFFEVFERRSYFYRIFNTFRFVLFACFQTRAYFYRFCGLYFWRIFTVFFVPSEPPKRGDAKNLRNS